VIATRQIPSHPRGQGVDDVGRDPCWPEPYSGFRPVTWRSTEPNPLGRRSPVAPSKSLAAGQADPPFGWLDPSEWIPCCRTDVRPAAAPSTRPGACPARPGLGEPSGRNVISRGGRDQQERRWAAVFEYRTWSGARDSNPGPHGPETSDQRPRISRPLSGGPRSSEGWAGSFPTMPLLSPPCAAIPLSVRFQSSLDPGKSRCRSVSGCRTFTRSSSARRRGRGLRPCRRVLRCPRGPSRALAQEDELPLLDETHVARRPGRWSGSGRNWITSHTRGRRASRPVRHGPDPARCPERVRCEVAPLAEVARISLLLARCSRCPIATATLTAWTSPTRNMEPMGSTGTGASVCLS
jgi:hypothetical protein